MWQQNLFNNLIVIFVLGSLAGIIYCKVTKKTMLDVFKEIKEMLNPADDE